GRIAAHFESKPRSYNQSKVTVAADYCKWLPLCELVGDRQDFVTGRYRLTDARWSRTQNMYGYSLWTVEGVPQRVGRHHMLEANMPLMVTQFKPVTMTDNAISSCRKECDGSNTPRCLKIR